jgi:hypothetical protein
MSSVVSLGGLSVVPRARVPQHPRRSHEETYDIGIQQASGEGPQRRGDLRGSHVLRRHTGSSGETARGGWAVHRGVRDLDPKSGIRTGLRDTRHVIFDDGLRLLWCMTFEGAWDACVDNALLVIGVEHFLDWLRHTAQGEEFVAWVASGGGVEKFDKNEPEVEETMKRSSAQLMTILQSVQTQAVAYFNPLGALTLLQIIKAHRLEQAFQRVLGNPVAAEALRHPAPQPLLRQATYRLGDSRASTL